MIDEKDIPAKMLTLRLKDPNLLYNYYMQFLGHGDLFVLTDDVFSLGEDILLAVEVAGYPRRFLPTKVIWVNPARISAHCPKDVGFASSEHESCRQAKNLVKAGPGPRLHSDHTTFTL